MLTFKEKNDLYKGHVSNHKVCESTQTVSDYFYHEHDGGLKCLDQILSYAKAYEGVDITMDTPIDDNIDRCFLQRMLSEVIRFEGINHVSLLLLVDIRSQYGHHTDETSVFNRFLRQYVREIPSTTDSSVVYKFMNFVDAFGYERCGDDFQPLSDRVIATTIQDEFVKWVNNNNL